MQLLIDCGLAKNRQQGTRIMLLFVILAIPTILVLMLSLKQVSIEEHYIYDYESDSRNN